MRHLAPAALVAALALFLAVPAGSAQFGPPGPDGAIDARTRAQVVDGVLRALDERYVFPDTARAMGRAIRERMRRKEYDGITSARELAQRLTRDLREVSRDKHLSVVYSARPLPPSSEPGGDAPAVARPEEERFARRVNHGVEGVQRLAGNVGYLELRGFIGYGEAAAAKVAAAMTLLRDTDALIVDLRRNGGGDPRMVAHVSSYLFGPEPFVLNRMYWREGDRTEEFRTEATLPGPRYGPERPVHVLTSGETFSGAEEFAYNLKNLERATIVGEVTGGGAHPVDLERISDNFGVLVPTGRAVNPVTGTNWERVGVEPDVKAAAPDALRIAHVAVLEALLERARDPEERELRARALREVKDGGADGN